MSASSGRQAGPQSAGGVASLEAPELVTVRADVEIEHETFLEIRDRDNNELVTVIELLSPTNKKSGPDRDQFLAKRINILRSAAHYVEIDLLRGWHRCLANRRRAAITASWSAASKAGRRRLAHSPS